ncbi:hypothetical protein [Streptomyces sp. NPDC057939]|uniref:hypothetical protein n=1 Tax=Streptomyces sp. NPDC057939 TaxID=3346284 RepID=UPI0036E2FD16
MSDIVKYLPPAAIPAGGAPEWKVADAERWRAARVPAVLGPVAGGWILLPLVLCAVVLLAWNTPEDTSVGTEWGGYPAAVLLLALPAWYRFLPVATAVAAPLIALDACLVLGELAPDDAAGRVGAGLIIGTALSALTGAVLRLRSRRIQRALILEAAGEARSALPDALPHTHRIRGRTLLLTGAPLCALAAALILTGLAQDLNAPAGHPYDATGQQVLALLLLVPGTPLLGRGITAGGAARRLHHGGQPVLRVGVRRSADRAWILADARTPTAPPLVAFRNRFDDSYSSLPGRILVGGPQERLRADHHDIDPFAEPYEALMYGVPREGAEVVLEFAVNTHDGHIVTRFTAAPLMPFRRSAPRPWTAAGTSYAQRREDLAERHRAQRSSSSSSSGSCGSSGGCGSSCGSSCGGGCGGD